MRFLHFRKKSHFDETMFTNISNILNTINENHIVIGRGDLNARIGNINRKNFKGHYRKNPDTVVDTHGKSFFKIVIFTS